jgi:hypothetical protein
MRCLICGGFSSLFESQAELWSNGERMTAICPDCVRSGTGQLFSYPQKALLLPILPGHTRGPNFCTLPVGYRPLQEEDSSVTELMNLIELGRWKAACRFQYHTHATSNLLSAVVRPCCDLNVPLIISPPVTREKAGLIEFCAPRLIHRLAMHKDSIRAMGLLIEAGVLSSMSAWNSEGR